MIIWLYGRSAAGKTSVAQKLYETLSRKDNTVALLDADEIRPLFWPELGWSAEDRNKNIARLSSLAMLVRRQGGYVVVSAITPFREMRQGLRATHKERLVLAYVDTPVVTCKERDPKKLYARGASMPFETPLAKEPNVVVDGRDSVDLSVFQIMTALEVLDDTRRDKPRK